jgi:hypothetical protein
MRDLLQSTFKNVQCFYEEREVSWGWNSLDTINNSIWVIKLNVYQTIEWNYILRVGVLFMFHFIHMIDSLGNNVILSTENCLTEQFFFLFSKPVVFLFSEPDQFDWMSLGPTTENAKLASLYLFNSNGPTNYHCCLRAPYVLNWRPAAKHEQDKTRVVMLSKYWRLNGWIGITPTTNI